MRVAVAPKLVSAPELDPAEVYATAWVRMNQGVAFAVRDEQVRYLQAIALGMEDEIASLLLLKKLKLAHRLAPEDPAHDLVGMNSYVEFRFAPGYRHFCRLLHPSVCSTSFDLSIDSRLGAGVVGLRAGQTLLWPDARGNPRELHVIDVKNGNLATLRSRRRKGGDDDLPPAAA